MTERLALRPLPSADLRCAYCHGSAADAATCAGCGTWTHPGCLTEAGACPTLGCPEAAPRPPRRVRRRARPVGFVAWWTRNRRLAAAASAIWTVVATAGLFLVRDTMLVVP
ncbi:MAG: hypothetical protein M9894_05135 [Planctomycetes bacterium]|nr:hypothetical protein [Planctomycetota bacterium]